jgi:uncharacterized membrane protein
MTTDTPPTLEEVQVFVERLRISAVSSNTMVMAERLACDWQRMRKEIAEYTEDPGGYLAVGGFARQINELTAENVRLRAALAELTKQ